MNDIDIDNNYNYTILYQTKPLLSWAFNNTYLLLGILLIHVAKHIAFGSKTLALHASSNQLLNKIIGSLGNSSSNKPFDEYSFRNSSTLILFIVDANDVDVDVDIDDIDGGEHFVIWRYDNGNGNDNDTVIKLNFNNDFFMIDYWL